MIMIKTGSIKAHFLGVTVLATMLVSFHAKAQASGRDIVINEISATNHMDRKGTKVETEDWIELFNRSERPVSLEGYFLSDDFSNPLKWALPAVELDAGAYLVIWADDKPGRGKFHANFKISAEGEEIILSQQTGTSVDMISFGEQTPGLSLGRWPDARGGFIEMEPTFNGPNTGNPAKVMPDEPLGELQLYRDPSEQVIHIISPDLEPGRMYVYNSFGQLFYRGPHKESMDISFLNDGHYILKSGSQLAVFQVEK